eukprot:gene3270-3547_t
MEGLGSLEIVDSNRFKSSFRLVTLEQCGMEFSRQSAPQDLFDGQCFALELERDIAELEALACRDECWDMECTNDVMASSNTDVYKAAGNILSCDQDNASDLDSGSESDEPENTMAARIQANALMVEQCGRPLQMGGWKGCCKSAWCDREDRHRGLCNHRATIPGPAACSGSGSEACSTEQGEVHCLHVDVAAGVELSSGNQSHNRQETADSSDDREVASALKSGSRGCMQDDSDIPLAGSPGHDQNQGQQCSTYAAAAADPCTPSGQNLPSLEMELWGSSGSTHLASTNSLDELSLPTLYQPLVKDLSGMGLSNVLNGAEEVLCSMDQALDAAVQPLGMGMQPPAALHSAAGVGAGLPRVYADPSSIIASPLSQTAAHDFCAAGDASEPPNPADDGGAVSAVPLHATSARVRAIRDKQAEKAAKALLEQQSSPKSKKRPAARMAANPTSGHSCSQCGATSTPVWRAGPAGPKTLCNACGVRYMKNARRK